MRDMESSNKDIQMSKGYAIVSMLMLYLFCLRREAVIGTPLIWLSEKTCGYITLDDFVQFARQHIALAVVMHIFDRDKRMD